MSNSKFHESWALSYVYWETRGQTGVENPAPSPPNSPCVTEFSTHICQHSGPPIDIFIWCKEMLLHQVTPNE